MRPILALLALILGSTPAAPALALSGATADGEDRFPYVVEIRFDDSLICSGTVLFPRLGHRGALPLAQGARARRPDLCRRVRASLGAFGRRHARRPANDA